MHPSQQWELVSLTYQERLQEANHWRLARQHKAPQTPLSQLRQSIRRISRHARPQQNLKLAHSD